MAMSLEHLQHAQRNTRCHVRGVRNGWDKVIEFGRQKQRWRDDFMQSIANVVTPQNL